MHPVIGSSASKCDELLPKVVMWVAKWLRKSVQNQKANLPFDFGRFWVGLDASLCAKFGTEWTPAASKGTNCSLQSPSGWPNGSMIRSKIKRQICLLILDAFGWTLVRHWVPNVVLFVEKTRTGGVRKPINPSIARIFNAKISLAKWAPVKLTTTVRLTLERFQLGTLAWTKT